MKFLSSSSFTSKKYYLVSFELLKLKIDLKSAVNVKKCHRKHRLNLRPRLIKRTTFSNYNFRFVRFCSFYCLGKSPHTQLNDLFNKDKN